MKIYVGYIIGDYSHACFMGTDRNKIQKALDDCPTNRPKYIEEYEINDNTVIELDID